MKGPHPQARSQKIIPEKPASPHRLRDYVLRKIGTGVSFYQRFDAVSYRRGRRGPESYNSGTETLSIDHEDARAHRIQAMSMRRIGRWGALKVSQATVKRGWPG